MDSKEERRILVAVDGGDESLYALSWCLKNVVSDNYSDTLILLYAKAPRAVYPALDGTGYLFSSDVIATAERYSNDLAESILEKCRRVLKDSQNVCSKLWRFANSTSVHVPIYNTCVRSEPSILLEMMLRSSA